jgi:hypothetical protein
MSPRGTGKTQLATGLAIRACQAGHQVLFATAAHCNRCSNVVTSPACRDGVPAIREVMMATLRRPRPSHRRAHAWKAPWKHRAAMTCAFWASVHPGGQSVQRVRTMRRPALFKSACPGPIATAQLSKVQQAVGPAGVHTGRFELVRRALTKDAHATCPTGRYDETELHHFARCLNSVR